MRSVSSLGRRLAGIVIFVSLVTSQIATAREVHRPSRPAPPNIVKRLIVWLHDILDVPKP
jgi:hypothetical protein